MRDGLHPQSIYNVRIQGFDIVSHSNYTKTQNWVQNNLKYILHRAKYCLAHNIHKTEIEKDNTPNN